MIPQRSRVIPDELKRVLIIIIGLIVIIVGLYLGWGYYRIERDSYKKENQIVKPKVDSDSISEIGYVLGIGTKTLLWQGVRDVTWYVKIPKTNRTYVCDWIKGFSNFSKDDSVILIHYNGDDLSADYSGYLIKIHGDDKGKSALVNAVDVYDTYYFNE
jgi:hypothetical protein